MNAPFRHPATLPPIQPLIVGEAAVNAWHRDRRAYDAGFCDDPAPYPCCFHTFEGDAAPVYAVRVTLKDGTTAHVRMSEIDEARALRRAEADHA